LRRNFFKPVSFETNFAFGCAAVRHRLGLELAGLEIEIELSAGESRTTPVELMGIDRASAV